MFHDVLTSEKVPFRYRVAGLGSRLLAYLIDVAFLFVLGLVGLMVANVLEVGRGGAGVALLALWYFLLMWGYFPLFEWLWQGQTPGKRLLGIRVILWQGTSLTFFAALVRNLLRAVDWLPLLLMARVPVLLALFGPFVLHGVSFVVAACNRQQRRPGDLAAGTLVVHVERAARPIRALYEAHRDIDAAHRERLREKVQRLDRPQKEAILDLCLRRDQIRVADRTQLFRQIAEYFEQRLDVVPAEYQSDEKFVLEAVSVLGEPAEAGANVGRGKRG
jgi:uncharacterized RDD family membrane protein YckC